MFLRLHRFLAERSVASIGLLTAALILIVSVADYWTGFEISFSIFYLVPVAVASWYSGRRVGFVTCFACALTWFAVDYSGGHSSKLAVLIWNASVRLGFFAVTAYLLVQLRSALSAQMQLAQIDALTKVLNRRAFEQRCVLAFQLASRHSHPICLGYLDIDNFKHVNDEFGHAVGDDVLCDVAAILAGRLRQTDIVGRLGGDEFAIAMPETGPAGANSICADLTRELARISATKAGPIGVSLGVVAFQPPPPTLDEAIRRADRLMYVVKRRPGRGFIVEECPGARKG